MTNHKLSLINNPQDFNDLDINSAPDHGLIAISESLTPELTLEAYRNGIFPWFNRYEPVLWWSPNPRQILQLNKYHVSKSLKKVLKKNFYEFKVNKNFLKVVNHCKDAKRIHQDGTWIDERIVKTYCALNKNNNAISFELYEKDILIAGIYGVLIKHIFYGESMFHLKDNASKICFFYMHEWLANKNVSVIDAQVESKHIKQWGGELVPRARFIDIIKG